MCTPVVSIAATCVVYAAEGRCPIFKTQNVGQMLPLLSFLSLHMYACSKLCRRTTLVMMALAECSACQAAWSCVCTPAVSDVAPVLRLRS